MMNARYEAFVDTDTTHGELHMSAIVKYILAARFLELGLRKFHRAVVELEDSAEFRTWRREGRVRQEHFPCDDGECTPNILGRFTEGGFEFSCRHFAVTYAIDPGLAVNKSWHRMRHVTQRNGATARILWLIAECQRAHLRCGDPLELRPYPYEDVIGDHRARWPDHYIDASIISRVIKNKPVIGYGGKRVLLADLLPGRTQWLGHRIANLLGHVDRQLGDAGLAAALEAHYGLRIGRRYVAHCRRAMGIAPLRDRLGKALVLILPRCSAGGGLSMKRLWPGLPMARAPTS